jgi:hypothetical protein
LCRSQSERNALYECEQELIDSEQEEGIALVFPEVIENNAILIGVQQIENRDKKEYGDKEFDEQEGEDIVMPGGGQDANGRQERHQDPCRPFFYRYRRQGDLVVPEEAAQQVVGQEAGLEEKVYVIKRINTFKGIAGDDGQQDADEDIFIFEQIVNDEIKGNDKDEVLQVPEIAQRGIQEVLEHTHEGEGLSRHIPDGRMEDGLEGNLHQFVDEKEGHGPDDIGNDETVKTIVYFFAVAEILLCLVKEQVSGDDRQTGRGEIEHEIENVVVVGYVDEEQVYGPMIYEDDMDDQKPDLIDVQ